MSLKGTIYFLFCLEMLLVGSFLNADEDNQNYSPVPPGGSWAKDSNTKYEHRGAVFSGFRYSDNTEATNTYKFTVGRPSYWGWYFIPSKTGYSGGTKLFDATAESAGIKKVNEADKDPVSFSMSMNGQLTKGGGGSGTVYWDAKVDTKFFYLSPHEQVVKAGADNVKVEAKGSTPLTSTWEINTKDWKDHRNSGSSTYEVTSITLNRDMWDKMQWTPDPVPDGFDPPTADKYIITATTTESSSRSATAIVYVVGLKDVEVKKKGTTGRPASGLVVKTGDQVTISVSVTPSNIVGDKISLKWYIRQMGSTGTYGTWSNISSGNDKTSFDYTTSAGIFQLKAEITLPDSSKMTAVLERTTDETYGPGRAGNPDAYGVASTDVQTFMRDKAMARLGSNTWAFAASRTYPRTGQVFAASTNKCNLFVAEMGDRYSPALHLVPLINGYIPPYDPPLANQWAGTQSGTITDWTLLGTSAKPEPGFVVAFPRTGMSGHVGILDYDGVGIGAGTTNVNKNFNFYGTDQYKNGATRHRQYTGSLTP